MVWTKVVPYDDCKLRQTPKPKVSQLEQLFYVSTVTEGRVDPWG